MNLRHLERGSPIRMMSRSGWSEVNIVMGEGVQTSPESLRAFFSAKLLH